MNIIAPYRIKYDHTFTTYEHKPDTNLYSFQYPEHWLSFNSNRKSVKVRSVRVNAAARDINIKGLVLRKGSEGVNISFNLSLASDEDMSVLNSKLNTERREILEEYKIDVENARLNEPLTVCRFAGRDYEIKYNFTTGSLHFSILTSEMFFEFLSPEVSDDFCSILNLDDGSELFKTLAKYQASTISKAEFDAYLSRYKNEIEIEFANEREVMQIVFKNVWNRSKIIVTSSLSSLCENRYLMLSNTVNRPPKMFEINGFNKGFELSLIDLDERREIELPADGKDKIVVEMILLAV